MPLTISYPITIDKIAGLGDGVGSHDGVPVFVAKSTAGDVVRVTETSRIKDSARADILEILTPGPDRAEPICPHYARCGGCSLQHLTPESYQSFKQGIVASALGYGGFADIAPTFHFLPPPTRRRADFKVDRGHLAYLAPKSHERVAIEHCPILTPALQALITPLNELLAGHDTRNLQLTESDNGIDIQLDGHISVQKLSDFAAHHDIARINEHVRRAPYMLFGGRQIQLPAGAFLQASKEAETLMSGLVSTALSQANSIVEFFSGLGTYSFPLALNAKLTAYELDRAMVAAMNGANHPNISAYRRDLFKEPVNSKDLKGFDAAIVNPPRAGADAQMRVLAHSRISRIAMVSCNHATWSRDAKTLKNAGYRLVKLDVIDQFVYSPHVELVSVFTL